jgi:hypothetical protein
MKHSDLAFVAIELLACSWRQLIVEERGAPRRSTSPRAEDACRALSPRERAIATRAEDELRAPVKRSAAGHHG